jgi:ankyrin repeat protein
MEAYNVIEKELMEAFKHGHRDRARSLLEEHSRIDVNKVKDTFGKRPLHYSADGDDLDMSRYLVEVRNADVNITDGSETSPFITAAARGNLSICQFLQEKDADINHKNIHGETALIFAAAVGHLSMCQFLETKGANLNIVCKRGESALSHAILRGNLDICRFLYDKGASLDFQNKYGITAFMYACARGSLDICRFLEATGPDITTKDTNGDTALLHAARANHANVCQYLLNRGVDVNAKNKNGHTAAFFACQNGHFDLLKLFCFAGSEMPLPSEIQFKPSVEVESRTAILRYVEGQSLRQILLGLVSAKTLKNVGRMSPVKFLNVDLIRRLFCVLGGDNRCNI